MTQTLDPGSIDLGTLRRLWQGAPARHADAGYEEAIACAREQGLDLPMLG